jgi:hypothetical protein
VPLAVLALTLLGAAAFGLAASSAAAPSARVVVCPLARGAVIPCCAGPTIPCCAGPTIPCCGPPVRAAQPSVPPIKCCQPSSPCPSSLTIGSTPNPSMANRRVVISGRLLGAVSAGVSVALWQRVAGESRFQQIAHATTDPSGMYTITRAAGRVQTDRRWYVTAAAMRSSTLKQSVEAVVTLAVSAGEKGSTIFAGHVTPSHKGERILLQRRTPRGWRTIARPRLTGASSFLARHRVGRGTVVLQAVLPADGMNALSRSAPVTLHSHS